MNNKTWINSGKYKGLFVVMILSALLGPLGGCGKEKQQTPSPPTVTVAEAQTQTVPLLLDYVGTIQSIQSVDINARVEGFLIEQAFKDGSDVKEGDLLFVIDPQPFEAALKAAEAQLSENLASLAYAKEQVIRYKPLVDKDYITKDAYDEYLTQAAEAGAMVQADRANVTQAKLNLGYCTMRGPFDGRIGRRFVDVGNLVGAAGEPTLLATLVQLDPIYVYFDASERDIPEILKQEKKNDLTITVELPNGADHPEKGTVDFVDNQIDTTTGTITLRAVIPNTEKTLIPGQFAKVQLLLEERPNQVVVPEEAVGDQQGSTYVYVVGKDNKVEFRNVKAGSNYKGIRIIQSGVKSGEMVIVNGLQKVKPGITVKTETEAQAKQRKSQASPKPTGGKSTK